MTSDSLVLKNNIEELELNFNSFRNERRQKIITMDRIITDNTEFEDSELDVLFRGFIVLIYAYWEGNYKEIQDIFYNFLSRKKISNLPHQIKTPVLIELSTNSSIRNKNLSEFSDYKQLESIYNDMKSNLDKKILDFDIDLRHKFYENSNNPSYIKLETFLSKFHINLNKLVKRLCDDTSLSSNFKCKLEFIILSRNDIAHGRENIGLHKTYQEIIAEKFLGNRPSTPYNITTFLSEIAFEIDLLYKTIFEELLNKYKEE